VQIAPVSIYVPVLLKVSPVSSYVMRLETPFDVKFDANLKGLVRVVTFDLNINPLSGKTTVSGTAVSYTPTLFITK
jgi:hypothetical protein